MLPARKRNFQIKKKIVISHWLQSTQSVTSHHFQIESDRNAKTSPTQLIFASSHTTTHTTTHTDTHTDTHTSPHHHITTSPHTTHQTTGLPDKFPFNHTHTNTQTHNAIRTPRTNCCCQQARRQNQRRAKRALRKQDCPRQKV